MIKKHIIPAALLAASIILSSCGEYRGEEVLLTDFAAADNEDIAGISEIPETAASAPELPAVEEIAPAEKKTSSDTVTDNDAGGILVASESEVRRRLEDLIINTAAENNDDHEIQAPLFGDFDGDGVFELIAVYGNASSALFDGHCCGNVWFASGDTAFSYGDFPAQDWLPPEIINSNGHIFIKCEACNVSDSLSSYYEIIKSRPVYCDILGCARQGLRPDGDGGDFTAVHSAYDMDSEGMGHTWKTYWLYYSPDEHAFYPYEGTEISLSELYGYKGASEMIEKKRGGYDIYEIYRRENGIINVNLRKYTEEKDFNDETIYMNRFITLKISGDSVTDITPEEDQGYYLP